MVYEPGFGEWLSRQRKILGLTQKEMAKELNIATITLRKIEAEQRKPSLLIAQSMARILSIPHDQLAAFFRFARGDWQSIPAVVAPAYPWTQAAPPSQADIPVYRTRLVGREAETGELLEHLEMDSSRIITLIGPPGVGKSHLGIEVMLIFKQQVSYKVHYLDLAAIEDAKLLYGYVLHDLGFTLARGENPLACLKTEIADNPLLLVLDNAEHLVASVTMLVYQLIQACPNLKVIVTSQEALHLAGEVVFPVLPLKHPAGQQVFTMKSETLSHYPAVRLFVESARIFQAGFSINHENARDIAVICEHLEGLPLAIQLIASRLRILTPRSLLARLDSQFLLHSSGQHSIPAYHSSLRTAFDRSYSLLKQDEKLLFTYLSIFNEDFSLDTVESTFSATPPHNVIADLLSSLLDKSLLQPVHSQSGEPRFIMLKIIREYAAEHLKDFEQDAVASPQLPFDFPSHSKALLAEKNR